MRTPRFLLLAALALIISGEPSRAAPRDIAQGGRESSIFTWPSDGGPPYLFPVTPEDFRVMTSPFGWRVSPLLRVLAHHDGLDIDAVPGAQVVAVADGWVVELWPPPDGYYRGHELYGGMITLEHRDGSKTLYAHLARTLVWGGHRAGDRGQYVRAGQTIGRIGRTGKAIGDHLHFEVIIGGVRRNPLLYVEIPPGARYLALPETSEIGGGR